MSNRLRVYTVARFSQREEKYKRGKSTNILPFQSDKTRFCKEKRGVNKDVYSPDKRGQGKLPREKL